MACPQRGVLCTSLPKQDPAMKNLTDYKTSSAIRKRLASSCRTVMAMSTSSISSDRKSQRVRTRHRVVSVATTDAVRRPSSSRAISPKKSAAPKTLSTTLSPLAPSRTTCALPDSMTNSPSPPLPWVTMAHPAPYSPYELATQLLDLTFHQTLEQGNPIQEALRLVHGWHTHSSFCWRIGKANRCMLIS